MDEYIGNEYISDEDSLQHEGVLERSGRFPWGSGEHPFQRLGGIYGEYKKAKQKGLSDGEIAQQLDMTVGELRARNEYYVALKFNKNVAEARAMDLSKTGTFSHTTPNLGTPAQTMQKYGISYTSLAENLAGNSSDSAAVTAWMNSSGHKTNMLNEKYKKTGIGVVTSPKYGKIYCQIFTN
jgi:uncharacterized protein YkwD